MLSQPLSGRNDPQQLLSFDAFQHRSFRIRCRLGASAKIRRQKAFHCRVERHVVFRTQEAVTLIRENVVLDRLTIGAHGRDDLVTFRLLDTGIVRALAD